MKNAFVCTAAVLGMVFVGSVQVEAGRYRNAGHRSYNSQSMRHTDYSDVGRQSDHSYGDTHLGTRNHNSGYGRRQARGTYSITHGYPGASLQIYGNRLKFSYPPSRNNFGHRANYGH